MKLSYDVHSVNIQKGEQHEPAYLKISPTNKIPAIVDPAGPGGKPVAIFESGAILIHLAKKTGLFWSEDPHTQMEILKWLMWQVGGFGPPLGQLHHFRKFSKTKVPYAIDRFDNMADNVYGILDKRLSEVQHAAGEYSIADFALYPWVSRFEWQNIDLEKYPNVNRWFKELSDRPEVQRGMKVPFLN